MAPGLTMVTTNTSAKRKIHFAGQTRVKGALIQCRGLGALAPKHRSQQSIVALMQNPTSSRSRNNNVGTKANIEPEK